PVPGPEALDFGPWSVKWVGSVVEERQTMRRLLSVPLMALVLGAWVTADHPAEAGGYSGAASTHCSPVPPCQGPGRDQLQRQTVLQTIQETVYVPQQVQCVREVCETVLQPRTVTTTRNVTECGVREVPYTVQRPCYRTVMRQCAYTVQRPVSRTIWKEC